MEARPWHKYYDEGAPVSIDYPQKPLYHFLEDAAKEYPDKACSIFKGASVSYAEMDEMTDRLAAALKDHGVDKGSPVGIFMPNSAQFIMAFYAIIKAGGIVVATNPLYTAREIEHQMNDAGVELMLVMSNFYELIKEGLPAQKRGQRRISHKDVLDEYFWKSVTDSELHSLGVHEKKNDI